MRCTCGTSFSDDEHRCPHCGRSVRTIVLPDTVSAAVAPQPQLEPDAPAPPPREPQVRPRQAQLFGQKIIPFETLASRSKQNARRREAVRAGSEVRSNVRAAQPDLNLAAPATARAPSPVAYGDAGAAGVGLRARAAAVDAILCAAAIGIFAATFHFMGGSFTFGRAVLPGWIGAVALLGFCYHLFFALLGRNTAGTAFCGLAVVTFDGTEPGAALRVGRLIAALIGTAALGLGLIWALFDEEHLTWHDQITKSFPTKMRKWKR